MYSLIAARETAPYYNIDFDRTHVGTNEDYLEIDVEYLDTELSVIPEKKEHQPPQFKTREEWLKAYVELMRPMFASFGYPLPEKIRCSCGWPKFGGSRRIGECWMSVASDDNTFEIFITPAISDPLHVAAILQHELCHTALPADAGHKKPFKNLATKVGLTGKMTATVPTEEFKALLLAVIPVFLGEYPHKNLNTVERYKKQSTRLVKLVCPECGMIIRTTRQWLNTIGAPICADGGVFDIEDE